MVYMAQCSQGLSEKGACKRLPHSTMLPQMVADIVANRKNDSLFVLYCADGSGEPFPMNRVERKVLERLITQWCPGVHIIALQFSFHDVSALQMLQLAQRVQKNPGQVILVSSMLPARCAFEAYSRRD